MAGTVLFLSIIISGCTEEQNTHFRKCSRWLRGGHRERFLSGHKATGRHCGDAVEWTAGRHWPAFQEQWCLSYRPISRIVLTVSRCRYLFYCRLSTACLYVDMERVVSVYREEHEPPSAGAVNRLSFFFYSLTKVSWRGKRTIPFTRWVTHHPRRVQVGPAAMRLTFASKIVCLPPYEMLQAPQAERQHFFFMGKWRAGGGRTCAYNSRQRWAGVAVVPFWLYFCFSLLFSFQAQTEILICEPALLYMWSPPDNQCQHFFLKVPIITLGEYQVLVILTHIIFVIADRDKRSLIYCNMLFASIVTATSNLAIVERFFVVSE